MKNSASRYIHEEYTHDLVSPRELVPFLVDSFKPASVIDVGCGIGTFLYCFKEKGVKDVIGVDGNWTDPSLLAKYLSPDEFQAVNLSEDFSLNRKFDMALCLEVAEHLSSRDADKLVNNLVQLSSVIVFSAAIPDQGGQNHINEQWPDYWQRKFGAHDYHFLDMLRPLFWNNPKIHWWYRQNMFVVVHKSLLQTTFNLPVKENGVLLGYVHPELLHKKQQEIDRITSGAYPLLSYLKFIYKKYFRKAK